MDFSQGFGFILLIIGQCLLITICIMLSLAFLMYADRKIWAAVQMRKGPNVVGAFGILQSFADFLKYVFKEIVIPSGSDKIVFLLAPLITFVLSLVAWAVIPFNEGWVLSDIDVGILFIFAVAGLEVYGVIMGGWASNSKYPFLGSLRSAAQMISYEVSIGLIIISVLLSSGSLNLTDIVLSQQDMWYVIPHFPMFVIFFISTLAETNRAPFDLPEAESELVAGYNVEYSSMSFGLFFLGEYGNMILMSSMSTILFLGGWLPPFESQYLDLIPGYIWFLVKVVSLLFVFLWVRATLPRYRYDQLMTLGWKLFLPLSLLWIIITSSFMFFVGYV